MNFVTNDWRFMLRGWDRAHASVGEFFTALQAHLTPAGVAALFVLAGACLAYAAASLFVRTGRELDELLQPYRLVSGPEAARVPVTISFRSLLRRASGALLDVVETRGKREALEEVLVRAGLPIEAGEFLLLAAVFAVVLTLAGGLVAGLLGAFVALLGGFGLPAMYVKMRAERRHRAFDSQLPDVLKIVASSLRGGFSLLQGLTAVTDQCEDPMHHELGIAIARIRLGELLEDALNDVAVRTASQDFRWTVMAIKIQREVGGNLAGILDTVAQTMLERERIRREVRTLTAEGRMSAFILAAMPVALGAFIYMANRPYIEQLFSSLSGQLALGIGVLMEIFGGIWMYRTIKIVV